MDAGYILIMLGGAGLACLEIWDRDSISGVRKREPAFLLER